MSALANLKQLEDDLWEAADELRSNSNLPYNEFFLAYRDRPKVQPLVAQIGWTHTPAGAATASFCSRKNT